MSREMKDKVEELKKFAELVKKFAYREIPLTFIDNRRVYQEITGRTNFKLEHWKPIEEKLRLLAHNPRIIDGWIFDSYPPILTGRYTVFFYKSQETKGTAYARVFGGFRVRLLRKGE